MNLTWLGTGSAFNFADGNVSSLLEVGDRILLFDCGFSVPRALKELGSLEKVTDIFISHTHSDHIGGLELLAQWRYFVSLRQGVPLPRLTVTPDILESLRALESLGLGFIQDDFGRPVKATLETYFDVRVLPVNHPIRVYTPGREQTLEFRYRPVEHVPGGYPSYSFDLRIGRPNADGGWEDRDVLLSADTREAVGMQHDVVFHDCQLYTGPNGGAGDVHISLDRLIKEVPESLRNRYFLVHYGGNVDAHRDRAVEAGFAGFVPPGQTYDLWTVGPQEPRFPIGMLEVKEA